MKADKLKVIITELEDEKGVNELIAELKVAAVMKICNSELRLLALDDTLKILAQRK
jgi:hypothetical protein